MSESYSPVGVQKLLIAVAPRFGAWALGARAQ